VSASPTPTERDDRSADHGLRFWIGVVIGGGVMAYGAVGLVRNIDGSDLVNWLVYLVGADVLHDALVAPALFALGALAARLLPARVRTPITIGCAISAAVLLVGAIPLFGLGGNPNNPTLRPLDYQTAVLTALGIVWGVVLVVTLVAVVGRNVRNSA